MPQRKGFIAPQNTFLDTIATRFDGTHSNFVLGNAQVKEYPIVYCSDGFVELTGYSRPQIMSRCCSCSFLWGEKTTDEAKEKIFDALDKQKELQTEVVFHRKNESTFPCLLDIVPIKNEKGQVVLFLVSHKNLSFEKQKAVSKISAILGAGVLNLKPRRNFSSLMQRNDELCGLVQNKGFLSAGLATTVAAAALVNSSSKETTSLVKSNSSFDSKKFLTIKNEQNCGQSSRRQSSMSLNETKTDPSPNNQSPSKAISKLKTRRHSAVPAGYLRFNEDEDSEHNNSPMKVANDNTSMVSIERTDHETTMNESTNNDDTKTGKTMHITAIDERTSNEDENSSDKEEASVEEKSDDENDDDDSQASDPEFDEPSTAYKFQRRRSRAVLYNLSGRFDIKPKRNMQLKKIQNFSGKDSIPEYRVQDVQPSRFILLHYSIWKIIWDWLIFLSTYYVAVAVPYNFVFKERGIVPLDIFVGILFIFDVILNFLTTYVSKGGQVIFQPRQIAMNYVKGWLILDLIAAIPFDIAYIFFSDIDFVNFQRNWLNLMKLTRLIRLLRLFQKIDRYTQHSAMVLGLLMGMFFLISHWFACMWYSLGLQESEEPTIRNHSWLYQLSYRTSEPVSTMSLKTRYVTSLYFMTSSLTSVGFGNVSPNTNNEKIFSIFAMLVGALMHAAVFGNVTTIIQRMYARRSAYQMKHQDLKDFTQAHHIPKQLKQRMVEFFQAMWSINRGIDKKMIMAEFPEELRGEIALHLNRDMLSLTHFRTASPGCLKSIADIINTRFATPGEFLVHRGDVIKYLYFVCSGSLEILDEDNSVVALLGKFDLFGCDIDNGPPWGLSGYDVKSLTYCELQCIEIDTIVQKVLNLYPKFKIEFSSALHEDLSFNIREGYDPMMFGREERLVAINATHLPPIRESDECYDDDSKNCTDDEEKEGESNELLLSEVTPDEREFYLLNMDSQAPLGSKESLSLSQDLNIPQEFSVDDSLNEDQLTPNRDTYQSTKFKESIDQQDDSFVELNQPGSSRENVFNRRSIISRKSFSMDEPFRKPDFESETFPGDEKDNNMASNNNLLVNSVNNWKRFVEINSWKRKLSLDKSYNIPRLGPEVRSDPWTIVRQSPKYSQKPQTPIIQHQALSATSSINSRSYIDTTPKNSSNEMKQIHQTNTMISKMSRDISTIHTEMEEMRKQILNLTDGVAALLKLNQSIHASINIPNTLQRGISKCSIVDETKASSEFSTETKMVTFDLPTSSVSRSTSHQKKSSLKKRCRINPTDASIDQDNEFSLRK